MWVQCHCKNITIPPVKGPRMASLAPGVALREHPPELGWAGAQNGAQGSHRWVKDRDDEHTKVREGLGMPEGRWRVLHIPRESQSHSAPECPQWLSPLSAWSYP